MSELPTEGMSIQEVVPGEVRVGDLIGVGRRKDGQSRTGWVTAVSEPEYSDQMGTYEIAIRVDIGDEEITERHNVVGSVRRLSGARVQAPGTTVAEAYGGGPSYTELARIVAAHCGWAIDTTGQIFQTDGRIVSESIGVLARSLFRLGWIGSLSGGSNGIHWKPMPDPRYEEEDIASAVRGARDRIENAGWVGDRPVADTLRFLGLSSAEIAAIQRDLQER